MQPPLVPPVKVNSNPNRVARIALLGIPALAILPREILVGFGDVGNLAAGRIVVKAAARTQGYGVEIHRLGDSAGVEEAAFRLRSALARGNPLAQSGGELS